MFKRLLSIAIVLLLAGTASAQTQTIASESECRVLADRAVAMMAQDNFPEVITAIGPYTTLPQERLIKMGQQFVNQRQTLLPVLGKRVAMEFIRQEKIGDSMLRYLYLEKFENNALVIWFTFYRPESGWKMIDLGWFDKPQTLFK